MKEFALYAIVTPEGECPASYASEKAALRSKHYTDGCTIVKLTGQMPEPKKMKKVASYVCMSDIGSVFQSNQLLTEDAAKQECEKYNVELIKWPYGEVVEVPE
jgi:hypothetical protein